MKRTMPITTRLDLNVGYPCNNDCVFCYFKKKKEHSEWISFARIKLLLMRMKRKGIRTVEFTGGEVTLRNDFFEIIAFAKKEARFQNISIISNGTKLCDKDFAFRVKTAGVDDVLISLHGHNALLHDLLSGRQGSFDEVVKAIAHMVALGISCRINTVVMRQNYAHLSDIAGITVSLGVKRVNFIFCAPLDDAANLNQDMSFRYSDAALHVKKMIDSYRDILEMISVKMMPFCFLPGYEGNVSDFYQYVYDPYEWDYFSRISLRRNNVIGMLAALAGMACCMDLRRLLSIGFRRSLREGIARVEGLRHCVKSAACQECACNYICPGVWKLYAERFGVGELKPLEGKAVTEVEHYLYQRFPFVEEEVTRKN